MIKKPIYPKTFFSQIGRGIARHW